jgi:glutamate-ammonia-ligase adenylyltransferase
MRLRPSGSKGPVASNIAAFEDYQETQAWTWEKMALTRARIVTGDQVLKTRAEEIIHRVLCARRDREQTLADVRDMRTRMLQGANNDDHWDFKHVRGGLIEIEFVAQALQLVHAHDSPQVLQCNTIAALHALHGADHLTAADHEALVAAANLYQGLTQILRLCSTGKFDLQLAPVDLVAKLLRASGAPKVSVMQAMLADANRQVSEIFDRLIGVPAG